MQSSFISYQYLRYLFEAKGSHRIHSTFVFDLFQNVISENRSFYEFQAIEKLRRLLLTSEATIQVMDYGARSNFESMESGCNSALNNQMAKRKVKDIARLSSVTPKKGRLLFRLVNYLQPSVIVELGTSFGISTLYQQKARPEASFYTLEGSPDTAEVASDNFRKLNATGIIQSVGNFKDTLPPLLQKLPKVDYVFFDGNHRKDATISYFQSFLPKATENAVFVFDDIRWSREMYEAWKIIIAEKGASVTIDLFTIGLVFFRKFQEKEHFVIKF